MARDFGCRLLVSGCGLITLALAFIASANMLCVLRLLLGAVEAGIYPGVVYYLTTWFPDPYRIRMLGFFTLGSSLGNMVGGPINGSLARPQRLAWARGLAMGVHRRRSARIAAGGRRRRSAAVLADKARFLNEKDRQLLAAMHARASSRRRRHTKNPWSALWDPVVIVFGIDLYPARHVLLRHDLLAADHHSRLRRELDRQRLC